ncbi:MAG: cob(I)yrinic acid a,c-diamide adenosyltransferase [Oscillospiraceae bacterium]
MGLVHIYTGEGKGKTTAAIGLAARAVGSGLKVAFYEFLKGSATGEAASLKHLGVTFYCPVSNEKFTNEMSDAQKWICATRQSETLLFAGKVIENYDMMILDEAICAVSSGLLSEDELFQFIVNKPLHTELVLTGRGASARLCSVADYVSVINKLKHPYDKGTKARKGIEF